MRQARAKINRTRDEAMRHNLVVFNNPVLIQGLALTPVVAAASSLKTSVMLCFVAPILIIPTRFLGDLLIGFVAKNLRPFVYAVISALCFIPAIMLVSFVFGQDARGAESYIALMVVDGIVLSRSEIPAREGPAASLRNGLFTALGLDAVLVITGILREIIGVGRIWGVTLIKKAPLPVAATVAGGFILAAILSALVQWFGAAHKRAGAGGAQANE
jgi:Na+-transporting NADH:ubiquinone oxidoreductase subunit NqrD